MRTLPCILALFTFHFSFFTSASAQPLDSAYHDNAEILSELQRYADAYPDWMTLDSIGHSAEYGLPIWCAKISDNPRNIEPEAALLFVGQVHAEEVVGIELVLEIMKQMLDNNAENAMRQRLEGLEIYIIPTANPEGLDVVTSGRDLTFRKNCRDNVGDGVLRIQDGEGWDTSGVDINRNFGTHWDRGDTLYRPEENLRYNAYRGAAPFSEPESQALRDLAISRPFLYSIVYHSSRTGNSTELFIAPWFWRENGIIKRPPDYLAINALGERVAGMLPCMRDRESHYRPVQSMQRKGQLQDWFYVETGCIQYMAEVAADIHPAADTMRMVVADNLPAVWYLMDLALGLEGLDGFGTLTVMATDARTGEPLEAEIKPDDEPFSIMASRFTHPLTGRFDWLFPSHRQEIIVQKLGYNPYWGMVEIQDRERSVLEVALEPIDFVWTKFGVYAQETNSLIPAKMELKDRWGRRVFCFDLSTQLDSFYLPLDDYQATITSPDRLTLAFLLEVRPSQSTVLNEYYLPISEVGFSEDFSSNRGWEHDGNDWGITTFDGRSCLTESVVGDYPNNADLWLELDSIAVLDSARATMRIVHMPYCEPQDDYQQIEWWTNPDDVHSKKYSQLRRYRRPAAGDGPEIPEWDTLYISLDSLERGDLSVRFRTVSDDAIGEDGWLIDEVAVFVEAFDNPVKEPPFQLSTFNLQLHPNPFNSMATISYTLPRPGWYVLSVVDVTGREAVRLGEGYREAGSYRKVWNGQTIPDGVYFIRLEADGESHSIKTTLIK